MVEKNKCSNCLISITDVFKAAQNIKGMIRATPLAHSAELSAHAGAEVRLKLENQQLTGSFKLRGAGNVVAHLDQNQRKLGVIASTAGNHGLALAYAGQAASVPVSICLPHTADPIKISDMKRSGAHIAFYDEIEAARQAALVKSEQTGITFVSAYANRHMIAGGGTVGLEILNEWADTEVILVGIGGGGLTSGIAIAAKAINPEIEIWAIQSEASPTFIRWKEAGKPMDIDLKESIAEGISGFIEPDTATWPIIRDCVDRILPVSESEIKAAMFWMLDHHQQVVEPSGVAAVAAGIRYANELKGRKTAIVVTGGNISGERYRSLIQDRDSI